MGPTIIYNSEVTEGELRQYLDQLGVLDIARKLKQLRRNPRKRHSDPQKEREEQKYKQALLTILIKQARGLGWGDVLPPRIDPFAGLETVPKVLADLTPREMLKLIQNQAKLLLKIAPRSVCYCDDPAMKGRQIIVPMTIMQNPKGALYWGVPKVYTKWSPKKKHDFYVYDATGKKRKVRAKSARRGRKTIQTLDCHVIGNPNATTVSFDINDLRRNFVEANAGWPVAFLPKSWYVEDYQEYASAVPGPEPEWARKQRETFERHKALEEIFGAAGFLSVSEPRPVELIATEEPPTLEDIDGAETVVTPELLNSKLPNGEDAPPELVFTNPEDPYEWQDLALERWVNQQNAVEIADGSLREWTGGIVEACTGAGKTRFCFKAVDYVLNEHPDARISIVVPKKVLVDQWYEEVYELFHDRVEGISRHGSGFDEAAQQISIWVINTAANELPLIDLQHPHLLKYPIHFLIVDEVHRSTSRYFRQIYDFSGSDIESSNFLNPEYRLGVTATLPSGDEKSIKKFNLLVKQLGPVLAQYKYAHAIIKGTISPFLLTFLETAMTSGELDAYMDLTEKIRKRYFQVEKLKQQGTLFPKEYEQLSADEKEELGDPLPVKLMKFIGGARARIDWSAARRLACAIDLIRAKVAEGKKIIVFHKSIDGATALYNLLHLGVGYGNPETPVAVGLYHSQNPPGVNEKFLDAFRRQPDDENDPGPRIQVLVSVQSLLEGLNVPDADVGVAVAADKSQIKAVQSLGRVLRIKPGSAELKEYYLICVKNEEGRGDEVVKAKFLGSLLDKEGNYIIPDPQTIPCWPHAGPHVPSDEEVYALHDATDLMSYDKIKKLALEAMADPDLVTRSKLVRAIQAYEEERKPAEDSRITRPTPVWPGWLGIAQEEKPPEEPPKSTPWRY